ncbi:Mediator of RNA polymerase II transcription subunit 10 [Phlyctochytrium bullatum]|nr:Mediator of RNA polymerase II transcription subunit 10 [Phlyctochytrium bullatum]
MAAIEEVEQKVLELVNLLFRTGVTVYDFQPGGAPILHRRINDIATNMAELDKLKDKLEDIQIPLNLVDFIEDGHNPDIYTKDLVQALVDKNQKTNGRIQMMKQFRNDLEREILTNFPELHDAVNSIETPDLPPEAAAPAPPPPV